MKIARNSKPPIKIGDVLDGDVTQSADSELIEACRKFIALEMEYRSIFTTGPGAPTPRFLEVHEALLHQLGAIDAVTPTGLQAKANAILLYYVNMTGFGDASAIDRAVWSLIVDASKNLQG